MKFEVLVNDHYVVLKNGLTSVWWNRSPSTPTNNPHVNSAFNPKVGSTPEFRILKDDDIENNKNNIFANFTCHGLAYGLIGLFLNDKLLLIKQAYSIGRLPFDHQDEVFKINKICVLSLASKGEILGDLGLDKCTQDTCTKPVIIIPSPIGEPIITASFTKDSMIEESSLTIHHQHPNDTSNKATFTGCQPTTLGVQKTWNQIKLTASNVKPRAISQKLGSLSTSNTSQTANIIAVVAEGSGNNNNNSNSNSKINNNNNNSNNDEKEKCIRRFIDVSIN